MSSAPSKPGAFIELMDFAHGYGVKPETDNIYLARIVDKIPTRWRWLALHPRLLRFAFFLRPSWRPDFQALRVSAEVAAEGHSDSDRWPSHTIAAFDERFGRLPYSR